MKKPNILILSFLITVSLFIAVAFFTVINRIVVQNRIRAIQRYLVQYTTKYCFKVTLSIFYWILNVY